MASTRGGVPGSLQWSIIALTVVTAVIHIWLGVGFIATGGLIFVLNGIGYLVLLAMLYLDLAMLAPYRTIVRWLLIAYTAVTVIGWVFIGTGSPLAGPVAMGSETIVAYLTKIVEVVLIVLLWLEGSGQPDRNAPPGAQG